MRTIAWSPRVGEAWISLLDGSTVEIAGDHEHSKVVLLRAKDGHEEWVPYATLERDYEQACCSACGVPLTLERKQRTEVEVTPLRAPYVKAQPGTYCTKPCCATRHAPKTC